MRRGGWRVLWLSLGALLIMGLVAVGFANADEEKAGTTAANFLELGGGPRIEAMGGATLGLGQDLAGAAWNPAALGWVEETAFLLAHAGLENESRQQWAAVGGRLGRSATRWALSGLHRGEGALEGRDDTNNPTGTFDAASFAIGAHLARRFGDHLTIGFGAKTVSEKLGDVTGLGTTFDGGLTFRRAGFGLGAGARNLGGRMRYDGVAFDFPATWGAGVAWSHASGVSFALDVNQPAAYHGDVRGGIEYRWQDQLAVRAGYRSVLGAADDPLSGPTFGLGAGGRGYWLDYAFLVGDAGASGEHRLAVTLFPGAWRRTDDDPFERNEADRGLESPGTRFIGPPAPAGRRK